jgi:hypothetical protein
MIRPSSSKEDKSAEIISKNSVQVWNPETASFKEYASYKEMDRETQKEGQVILDKYNRVTKGTIVEQVQNIAIPSYEDDSNMAKLNEGKIEVWGPKDEDFPNGIFLWAAYLYKDTRSFVVGDFNNDGLEDVAHIIEYTGGGSGSFDYLTVFINDKGKLKYLTQTELGDRVFIRGIKYNAGEFTADTITQGEGDNFMGYCCANVPKTLRFKLEDSSLVEVLK